MCVFSLQIKSNADELVGIGCPIKHVEYVDAILEGLVQEYAPIISIIEKHIQKQKLKLKFLPMNPQVINPKRKHSILR